MARHSDWLLAALVLLSALGISARDLLALRRQAQSILLLSLAPVVLFGVLSWALGRPFCASVRHGLLGTGLSSSEVASVGLVSLAGADATVALGVVTGSLIASAVIGPLVIGGDPLSLLGRFVLVVIVPLLVGVALRSSAAAGYLARHDDGREGLASVTVAALVYAALSGAHGAHGLAAATLASVLFLLVSAVLGTLWWRATGSVPGAFTISMRDFAVAATLATQAFGPGAGTVPGVYGVLMLVGGSIAAGRLRR